MRKLSLEKRPYSIDKYYWSLYKSYCNAVERGEKERAEKLKWQLWICGYGIEKNAHGQFVLVKVKKVEPIHTIEL